MTLKGCNNSTNSLLSSSALVEKCFIFTTVFIFVEMAPLILTT